MRVLVVGVGSIGQRYVRVIHLIAGRGVPADLYADGHDAVNTLAVAVAALQSAAERRFVQPKYDNLLAFRDAAWKYGNL